MSWLKQAATDEEDWSESDLFGLIEAMPPSIFPVAEQMLDRERLVLPTWLECRMTYNRFLFAALIRNSSLSTHTPRGVYGLEVARLLTAAPPWVPFDWVAYRDACNAAWRASLIDTDNETGRNAPPLHNFLTSGQLRDIVRWLDDDDMESDFDAPPDGAQQWSEFRQRRANVMRQVVGYPWRPSIRPEWQTGDVMTLARGVWADRAWDRTPILADALQDAGCDLDAMLAHLRDTSIDRTHGDWAVIDVLLPAPA